MISSSHRRLPRACWVSQQQSPWNRLLWLPWYRILACKQGHATQHPCGNACARWHAQLTGKRLERSFNVVCSLGTSFNVWQLQFCRESLTVETTDRENVKDCSHSEQTSARTSPSARDTCRPGASVLLPTSKLHGARVLWAATSDAQYLTCWKDSCDATPAKPQ